MAIEMTPTQIQKTDFPVAKKGYDPDAVRAHLRDAAAALENALRRAKLAEDQARRAAEATPDVAAPSAPEQQVADETARVLMAAREAAASMEEQARESVEQIVGQAETQAQSLTAEAEARARQIIQEAEAKAGQILAEAEQVQAGAQAAAAQAQQAEASGLVESARQEAAQIVESARQEAAQIVESARQEAASIAAAAEAERQKKLGEIESKAQQLETKRQAAIAELEEKRAAALAEIEEKKAELKAAKTGKAKAKAKAKASEETVETEAEVAPAVAEAKKPAAKAPQRSVEEPVRDKGASIEAVFSRFQESQSETIEAPSPFAAKAPAAAPGTVAETVESVVAAPSAAETIEAPAPTDSVELDASVSVEMRVPPSAQIPISGEEDSKVVGVLRKQLLRKMKRALQDEQNVVIEAIRQSGGGLPAAQLIPKPAESVRRIRKTVEQVLNELAKLGWSTGGGTGAMSVSLAVDDLLAQRLVIPIGEELQKSLGEGQGAGEQGPVLSDRVNNVYRNWKGPELAELAAELAHEAFMGGRAAVAS